MSPKSVHDDEISGRIFDWALYRRFLPFARPQLGAIMASVVLLLLLAVTTMTAPLVIRWAIDNCFEGTRPGPEGDNLLADFNRFLGDFSGLAAEVEIDAADRGQALGMVSLLAVALGVLTFVFRYLQLFIANRTGQRIIYDLRRHVFAHVETRSLRFFDTNPVGRLVTRVTSDIEALAELFTSGVDVVFYDLVMLGLTLGILFGINAELALYSLALVPFVGAWSFFFKREAQELFREVRSRVTRQNSFINESVTGMRVIQLFRNEARANDRFRLWSRELRDSHVKTVRNFSLFYPGIEFFSGLGAAVVLLVGNGLLQEGSLSIGDMFAFWILLAKFFEPLRQISEKYNVLQSAMASGERIVTILDNDLRIPDAGNPAPLPSRDELGRIEFDDVRFSYDGEQEVLKGISFKVAPGETIAIVGATGAGKSSIINVLGRFYDISGGSVKLGGVDIRELPKYELRRSVGIVLQEVFLFADTIRENIRLGDESFDDERIREAAARVYALPFIEKLEKGLDHPVEERGATFSLGEKQLLAFARTLAHDPPVLVLDEATANIDTETEHLIQRALERLMENRTVIVIAHRLSTIKRADRIIVMHHGEIRETGTHAQLLAADGIYRRLYELQYKNQEGSEGKSKDRKERTA